MQNLYVFIIRRIAKVRRILCAHIKNSTLIVYNELKKIQNEIFARYHDLKTFKALIYTLIHAAKVIHLSGVHYVRDI